MQPFRLEHPYAAAGNWYKGNLHTHTTLSDGELSPEATIQEYEQKGYDFLALSDHDLRTPAERYREKTGMVLLGATEVSGGAHILCVAIAEDPPFETDRQKVIAWAARQHGISILNHPNWGHNFLHWTQEQIETLTGYAGIEIYNGVIERLEGSSLALDRWDRLLSAGKRAWGYANDDAHLRRDMARGWNVVQATAKDPTAIFEALRDGRFYASTGVIIDRIEVGEDTVYVAARNAQRIRFIGKWGQELEYADSAEAAYRVHGNESYVRAECLGMGGQAAWAQPVYILPKEPKSL
ncbi:MAG: CehA/McbA family metallohydrolase [Armatimonadetes bacterium]|nr:CehA/McbA family metallohydrolase [Armatimonadota bacterium]